MKELNEKELNVVSGGIKTGYSIMKKEDARREALQREQFEQEKLKMENIAAERIAASENALKAAMKIQREIDIKSAKD